MDSYDDQITKEDPTQTEAEYLVWLTDEILFSKALWSGFYSGVYSKHVSGMVPKPTEDCLGEWITQDIVDLKTFRNSMLTDYWNVSISQYQGAWEAAGDLMFKNFDTCHFKAVMEDVNSYCSQAGGSSASKVDDEWSKYDFDTETEDESA